jgi:hypothetical protein
MGKIRWKYHLLNQHGFKRGKSASTLSAELQWVIARVLDENVYLFMVSLDLNFVFDVVNMELPLKRMILVGLSNKYQYLVKKWSYYVSIEIENSVLFDLLLGTVLGLLILGWVLYSVFISPFFEIQNLYTFADDSFTRG